MEDPGSVLLAPAIDDGMMVCSSCGALILAPREASADEVIRVLLAVCDVLVVKALEKMGNYIVRAERSRFNELGERPFYLAHTLWPATDAIVTKATKGAWDVVPLILNTHGPDEFDAVVVTSILDTWVHDLVVSGEPHNLNVLALRVRMGLGLPVQHITPVQG